MTTISGYLVCPILLCVILSIGLAQDLDGRYAILTDEALNLMKSNQVNAAWNKVKNIPDDFYGRMHMRNVKQEIRLAVLNSKGQPDDPKAKRDYQSRRCDQMLSTARRAQILREKQAAVVLAVGNFRISDAEGGRRLANLKMQAIDIERERMRLLETADMNLNLNWNFDGCAKTLFVHQLMGSNRPLRDRIWLTGKQIKNANEACISFFKTAISEEVTTRQK